MSPKAAKVERAASCVAAAPTRPRTGRRARGATLVEVLTVISIIGMMFAMFLPAVQAARESGRRVTCKNNLRQLAIACEAHHTTHNVYPAGQFLGPYGVGPDSTAWSFLARLLPYVERKDIYEAGDIPNETLRNSGVIDLSLALVRCPSDGAMFPRTDRGNLQWVPVGPTNYKGVSGANWGADASIGAGPGQIGSHFVVIGTNGSYDGLAEGDGMFYRSDYLVRRTQAHVLDGLGNTFMLGEDVPDENTYCSWPYSNNAYGTCAIPPNYAGASDPGDWPNTFGFRSRHAAGLHFALGDSSVRWINQSIAINVYRSFATIRGKDTQPLPQ
jgi:type II secretory pathway pseudopilin PulG